jgi:N-acetylneuraminic acid mutarotase
LWTGSEMIVWGGIGESLILLNSGGRYNPSTNSWTATSTTNAPQARYEQTAVWTGSEMTIWGGFVDISGVTVNTGGKYNPSTDNWTATSTVNAPDARGGHQAVWTGSEMIVWGGCFLNGGWSCFNTGGRYDPNADSWTAMSTTNAPDARSGHAQVWTGAEMIVWGGHYPGGPILDTGGRYDPATDSWTATTSTNAPDARFSHTGVWTGGEMIIWGGEDQNFLPLNTGGRYDPGMDSWTRISTSNAPDARYAHTAVWTGTEMIVWGGTDNGGNTVFNTGGRYCAQSGPTPTPSPTPTSAPCAVTGAACGSAVFVPPTDFAVNVTDPVDPATLDASDFTVNGTQADNVTLLNGNTTIDFIFNTSPAVPDLNTMHIPAGAFNCAQGPVSEFNCTFRYQLPRSTPSPRPRPTPHPRP